MKTQVRIHRWCAALALMLLMAGSVQAQRQTRQPPRGGPGRAQFMQRLPVIRALDTDRDGEISAAELKNAAAALKSLDKNKDGQLTQDELVPMSGGRFGGPGSRPGGPSAGGGNTSVFEFLVKKYDKNNDGKVAKDEYPRGAETFARLDRTGDGVLTSVDWTSGRGAFGGSRPGSGQRTEAPKVGERAPDFQLESAKQPGTTVRLSSFVGKKPVALIFGSCT